MFSRVDPMQDRCGAASLPEDWISITVSSVRSRVEPPAPKVTEKNLGLSCASCSRVARSLATPSGVFGGKNSKLNVLSNARWFCMSVPSTGLGSGLTRRIRRPRVAQHAGWRNHRPGVTGRGGGRDQ